MTDLNALADSFNKALNSKDVKKVSEHLTEDVTWWEAGLPAPIRGRKAVEAQMLQNWKGFPDSNIKTLNRIVSGDWVTEEMHWSGTHTGPLETPGQPPIPATGKRAEGKAVAVVQTKGGKIAKINVYYDNFAMMSQLGLIPQPKK